MQGVGANVSTPYFYAPKEIRMANIGKIIAKPRVVEILSPDGTGSKIGVRVTIRSIDDPKMKAIQRKIQNERNRIAAKGKYFKAEDTDENLFEVLFNAMDGWEWYNPTGVEGDDGFDPDAHAGFNEDDEADGEVPEFNRRMVKKVFEKLPWFKKQINDEVDDESAFFA